MTTAPLSLPSERARMVQRRQTRRRLLTGCWAALGLAAGAGCSDRENTAPTPDADEEETADPDADAAEGEETDDTGSTDDDTAGGDATDDEATNDGELDLREANVVDVAVTAEADTYAFDVTLHHDDDGEDGYANWWQVERLDGTRLGRRELTHAHSRQPFTRSATVTVPDDVGCVVVRGHDETHGYGGVAAVVDLDSGATRSVDQGAERRPFEPDECP